MNKSYRIVQRCTLGLLLTLASIATASAQTRVTLPAGTVFLVRTESALQSNNMAQGTTFETTVIEDLSINGYQVIPSGSRIRGVVAYVQTATRSQSGVMHVNFTRLTMPNGTSFPIVGKLTSTDSTERRQIDARADSRVVLVGERGGIGAAIAGAGSRSSSSSSILGALANMLSEGLDVNVPAGTTLAVQLEQSITLVSRGSAVIDESTIYTAPDRIRAAQQALKEKAYYRGVVNGVLDNSTRRALFEYQLDNNLSATGNLDGRTAASLGILNNNGSVIGNGAVLSVRDAAILRRAAQALEARQRSDLGINPGEGTITTSRSLNDADVDLLFAFSAFADNASLYEQFVRSTGGQDAAIVAGRALVNAGRRVDSVIGQTNVSASARNLWNQIRAQLTNLDASYR